VKNNSNKSATRERQERGGGPAGGSINVAKTQHEAYAHGMAGMGGPAPAGGCTV